MVGPIVTSVGAFRVLAFLLSRVDVTEFSRAGELITFPSTPETSRATGLGLNNVRQARRQLLDLTLIEQVAKVGTTGISCAVIWRISAHLKRNVQRPRPIKRGTPRRGAMEAARERRREEILDSLNGHVSEFTRDLQEANKP